MHGIYSQLNRFIKKTIGKDTTHGILDAICGMLGQKESDLPNLPSPPNTPPTTAGGKNHPAAPPGAKNGATPTSLLAKVGLPCDPSNLPSEILQVGRWGHGGGGGGGGGGGWVVVS